MGITAYSAYDLKQRFDSGSWYGESKGFDRGRIVERKAILKSFAEQNLFGITRNKNGSAYFKDGIKLDLKSHNLILDIVK